MLDNHTIQTLKTKLQALKNDLEEQLSQIANKDPKIKDNYKAKFVDEGRKEEDDSPKEYENYERNVGMEHELELELKKVNNALNKIATNQEAYGLCEMCKNPIDTRRLEARPHAVRCMQCKQS